MPEIIHRSREELVGLLHEVIDHDRSLPLVTQEQLISQLLDLQAKFESVITCR